MIKLQRVALIFILLLAISLPALKASGKSELIEATPAENSLTGTKEFISGLIDAALKPGTGPDEKNELLMTASELARTLSDMTGDRDFEREIEAQIDSIPVDPVSPDTITPEVAIDLSDIERYELTMKAKAEAFGVRARVEEFITGLIDKALNKDTSITEKSELLRTALKFARSYSSLKRDRSFYQSIAYIIRTMPASPPENDQEFILQFMDAVNRGNTFVQEHLVRSIQPRIEPFIEKLINKALTPGISVADKDELLKAAMNLAKVYSKITNDHTFHRRMHRKTFTARLSAPLESEATDGVHIIYAPKSRRTTRNLFKPDNMIIHAGETVKWINRDSITHVIGTLDFPSDGHFFAPSIGEGKSFKHTFMKPGEYYYICYIHRSMIGKITVIE